MSDSYFKARFFSLMNGLSCNMKINYKKKTGKEAENEDAFD